MITDHRAGISGRLTGHAIWSDDGDGLRQHEQGWLTYGTAPPMKAERTYLWRATASGIAVFFDDHRPFHRLEDAQITARHLCPPDIYDVRYDFVSDAYWMQHWHVTGERKNLEIHNIFKRLKQKDHADKVK